MCVKDNAAFEVTDTATDIQITGTVDVVVRLTGPKNYVRLVSYFESVLRSVRELVINPLRPIVEGIV